MIAYLESFKTDFKLGKIFLKKYPIIFDSDLKVVFSYILIGTIFLIIRIYFGRKFCILKSKRYANELAYMNLNQKELKRVKN